MAKAPSRTFGYARVSTYGQTLEAQLDQLRAAGCSTIFQEKVSGARADRKELAKLLTRIGPGDEVIVTKIDRLSRSLMDLFAIVKRISDAGARFRSLDPNQAMADTGTTNGRLMLAIMGWMADVERELILSRTQEGRARARAAGRKLGRRPKLNDEQRRQVVARLKDGETPADLARTYGVSWNTIARMRPKAGR